MGYAILDGFDLGVGILHPLVRGDHERRLVLNSIGPLWDGNEVWLVTFGGALFAAFPEAYATVLSGFYLPVMLVLLSLIGRAISIEFRSKSQSRFRPLQAFASSCASIAGLTCLAAAALYPNLVVSSSGTRHLDIWRAASSEATLRLMAIIAAIGMPLVATYTATVYWVFRGKVKLDDSSY